MAGDRDGGLSVNSVWQVIGMRGIKFNEQKTVPTSGHRFCCSFRDTDTTKTCDCLVVVLVSFTCFLFMDVCAVFAFLLIVLRGPYVLPSGMGHCDLICNA